MTFRIGPARPLRKRGRFPFDTPSSLLNGVEFMTNANTFKTRTAIKGSGDVGLLFIGDSTTAGGTGVSPSRYNGHIAQVGPLLTTRFGIANDFISSIGSAGHIAGEEATHAGYNPIVTFNSGTIQTSEPSFGGFAFQHLLTTGAMRWTPATQVPGYTFDRVKFAWRESGSTQIAWLDSTGASGTLSFGLDVARVQDIVCGAGATWIEVRCVSAGTLRFVGPVAFWTNGGARKFRLMNAGWVQSRVGDGTNNLDWSKNETNYRAQDYIPLVGAHLIVINLCLNDQTALTPLATYKANLKTLIATCKGTSDVLVMNGNQRDTAVVSFAVAQPYRDAARAASQESGVTYWDSSSVLGTYATALANGDMSDQTHPNVQGQGKHAAALNTGFFAQLQARLNN